MDENPADAFDRPRNAEYAGRFLASGLVAEDRAVLAQGEIHVSSNGLKSLFYLGGFDVWVSGTVLHEFAPGRQFARDYRTGAPIVSSGAALRRIVTCYPTGTMIVWGNELERPWALGPDVADVIATSMHAVELPATTLRVRAFQWSHAPAVLADCERVRDAIAHPRDPKRLQATGQEP